MKKFVAVLMIFALFSIFVISTSAGVPLTNLRYQKDLSKSFTEPLKIAISCIYKAPAFIGLVKGSSQTTCETTSDHFCYVWVRNKSSNGVESFDSNSGNVRNVIVTEVVKLHTNKVPVYTWHGAYRTIHNKRNLDARVEYEHSDK